MVWTKALAVNALGTGTRQVVKLPERSLLLLNEGGNIYAVDSICPHMKLPLKKEKLLPMVRLSALGIVANSTYPLVM